MSEESPQVDRDLLEQLRQLASKRSEVESWLEKAEELREKTSQEIYQRVCSDYRSRLAELDEQAAPLKRSLEEQYRKLVAHREVLQSKLADVQARRDELEFRRQIGEFGDADEESAAREVEEALKKQQSEVDAIDALVGEVLEVVPEEELSAAAASAGAEGADATPSEQQDAAPAGSHTVVGSESQPPPQPEPPPTPAPNKTVIFSEGHSAPASAPAEAAPESPQAQPGGRTVVVPPAELVEDKSGQPHRLGTFMMIGRGDQAQVRLEGTGVSRKHASISFAGTGFVIKDEGSHFGTFVNDERISEQPLSDGDRVQIGEVRLVFHLR
jgi:hypothetical protein